MLHPFTILLILELTKPYVFIILKKNKKASNILCWGFNYSIIISGLIFSVLASTSFVSPGTFVETGCFLGSDIEGLDGYIGFFVIVGSFVWVAGAFVFLGFFVLCGLFVTKGVVVAGGTVGIMVGSGEFVISTKGAGLGVEVIKGVDVTIVFLFPCDDEVSNIIK